MVHLTMWQRISGWCGVAFFALMAVAFFALDPNLGEGLSPDEFVEKAYGDDAVKMMGAFAIPAILAWLWFAAGVRERLAWGLGWSPLRAIGWLCAGAGATLMIAAMAGQSAMSEWQGDMQISAELTRASYYAYDGLITGAFIFMGMWMLTTGLAGIAWGGMPKWWAWPTLVSGLVAIVGGVMANDVAFLGFVLWSALSLIGGLWLAFASEPSLADRSETRKPVAAGQV